MAEFWATMRQSLERGIVEAERVLERANQGRVRKSTYQHNGHRHGYLAKTLSWGAELRKQRRLAGQVEE